MEYKSVRDMLDDRRNAEIEMEAIQREIDRASCRGLASLGSSLPRIEKVHGKDEYVYALRGTNNPQGAALQHVDGYTEALLKRMEEKHELFLAAERVIASARLSIDRTILRYYYCQAMTDEAVAEVVHSSKQAVWKRRDETIKELEIQWAGKL